MPCCNVSAQATGPPDATLVVIEADYLPEPEFGLSRIIEHAMVRAKDCVTFAHMNTCIPMVPRCAMALEGPDQSPKVMPGCRRMLCLHPSLIL